MLSRESSGVITHPENQVVRFGDDSQFLLPLHEIPFAPPEVEKNSRRLRRR